MRTGLRAALSSAPILACVLVTAGQPAMTARAAGSAPSDGTNVTADRGGSDLLDRRNELAREVSRLEMELPIAKTTQAYAVVDLSTRRILFKVRGRTLKSYEVRRVEVAPGAFGAPALGGEAFDRVYRLEDRIGIEIPNPLALQLAAAEAAAKAEEAAAAASGGQSDLEADTESAEEPPASSLIAPDPPPRFVWRLQDGLSIYVREVPDGDDPWARAADRVAGFAKRLGRLRQWIAGGGGGPMIYLYMDEEISREAYRSLLPGQQVILLSPSGS